MGVMVLAELYKYTVCINTRSYVCNLKFIISRPELVRDVVPVGVSFCLSWRPFDLNSVSKKTGIIVIVYLCTCVCVCDTGVHYGGYPLQVQRCSEEG